MAVPGSSDARLFYRCAFQRYEEAEVLLDADYTTGAVYLAGYGIECILKALVLMTVSAGARADMLKSFRGGKAHEYEWLRSLYLINGGARFPREITMHFTLVNDWSTDLRYTPRSVRANEAEAFLAAAVAIIRWAEWETLIWQSISHAGIPMK
jgi:HEPN domain